MSTLRKNVSGQYVYFGMVVAATGAAYAGTAGSITIQVAKDNAASGAGAGTMSNDGNGQFHYAPTQGETNGTSLGFFFTQATCIPVHFAILTTAADPTDTVRFGLTALPNVASGSAGAIPTTGTGANQIAVDGAGNAKADVNKWLAGTIPAVNVTGVPLVDLKYTLGTISPAAAGSVGIDWAQIANKSTAANLSATTVNLTNTLTTYTGNTVQTGDSFARIGAAGVGLTAVGLTGTQTFNNTGTWTGNVVGTVSTLTTYTGNTPQTGDSFARIGAAGASLTSVALTSAYDFAKGTVAVTESYAADGSAPTPIQALMLIQQILSESSIASTTLTVKKIDGTTSAATFTLSSATAPTSITRTT